MYLKQRWKYAIYFFIFSVLICIFLSTSSIKTISNGNTYITFSIFKIYDISSLVALIIGILAFLTTIYSVDRNYKSTKLSSLPENSTNLLIDLEMIFNEYKINKEKSEEDELIVLIQILKYWKNHQKAFRLLTPHFYKKFLKIISKQDQIQNNDENYVKNSKYIIMAIKSQITNIAFDNNENIFSFINPFLIKDEINIKKEGEENKNYIEFEINKTNFNNYINDINGEKTRKITMKKFKKINSEIKYLLKDLKREIEEYD